MVKYVKSSKSNLRYYVTDHNLIPLTAQPAEGYTKLEAIERAQREVDECVRLFGGKPSDHTGAFHIVDSNFHYCEELDSAI
jgi:hypothetical protein